MLHKKYIICVAALAAVAGFASAAGAQWVPSHQVYSIKRVGLFGVDQTGSGGLQWSTPLFFNSLGFVTGTSVRYINGTAYNGENSWVYNPILNATVQTGLSGTDYTGGAGFEGSINTHLNAAGQAAGYSERFTAANTNKGRNTWVYNPATNATVRTGLTGAAQTGSEGYQYSANNYQNAAGHVVGSSERYTGTSTYNGQNVWAYNPVTNTTVQTGFTGAGYTGSAGYEYSYNDSQNAAGQVVGGSYRNPGLTTDNGRDTWVYNPASNTTVQTGLTGVGYTGSAGYQVSGNIRQNSAGQVVGYSDRITGVRTPNGRNTWVYNPMTNTTVQTGLTGAAHTGSAGFQFSVSTNLQSAAGQVVGYSERISGASTMSGRNTWVYSPVTNATVQTGLTGAAHIGTAGYQYSDSNFQNEAGQVAGHTWRISGTNSYNGENSWVYDPATNTTKQTGLTGVGYTGTAGYQRSVNSHQNAAGQVAGASVRVTGVSTPRGSNTWVYNPVTNTTVLTGLTGAAHTGSAGYQNSSNEFQNAAGQVVGYSYRSPGEITNNGYNSWVYNPVTNTTVQAGLTEVAHTGSAGYQWSVNNFQNNAGQVVGHSYRIAGVNTTNGQDAWYFDPLTEVTSGITGSIRTSDNYAFSQGTLLTEGGFLLGYYTFFPGGLGTGEQRAFIFRPDLGLSDLGNLVSGGLTASGWAKLQNPLFADAVNTIVGYGYVNGQANGRSVFVMTIPAPGAGAMLSLGGLIVGLGARRRR